MDCKVPETPTVVNDDDPQPSESPAIITTSKGKGRGRQGKGKRIQPTAAELEASTVKPVLSGPHIKRTPY